MTRVFTENQGRQQQPAVADQAGQAHAREGAHVGEVRRRVLQAGQLRHAVLDELEAVGGEKLDWQFQQLSGEPSYGIFLQQHGETIVETLDHDFARLLLKADGQHSTTELIRGFDRQTAIELLQFAVNQGLLQPAS